MKPNRDANELAARLGAAASKPVPLPEMAAQPVANQEARTQVPKQKASKTRSDTVGITLRPSRALLSRYTLAAAERTRQEGRVVSAQEVMIEILERGP
jgi:hypothetical protein